MDTVDTQTRSKIMASVGQKDTGAEMLLRRALHRKGLRYRLHDSLFQAARISFFHASMRYCSFTDVTGTHMVAIGPLSRKAG